MNETRAEHAKRTLKPLEKARTHLKEAIESYHEYLKAVDNPDEFDRGVGMLADAAESYVSDCIKLLEIDLEGETDA